MDIVWAVLMMAFGTVSLAGDVAFEDRSLPPAEFTLVTIEYEGNNIWLPSLIAVKKGTKVKLNLINNVKKDPNIHGVSVTAFGVQANVTRGKPETVSFTADKPGIHRIFCHLHPKHIGAQILVLD